MVQILVFFLPSSTACSYASKPNVRILKPGLENQFMRLALSCLIFKIEMANIKRIIEFFVIKNIYNTCFVNLILLHHGFRTSLALIIRRLIHTLKSTCLVFR